MGGTGLVPNIDLKGCFAFQGAVQSYKAVPPQKVSKTDLSLPAINVGTEMDLNSAWPRSLWLRTGEFATASQPVCCGDTVPDQLILIASDCSRGTKLPEVN